MTVERLSPLFSSVTAEWYTPPHVIRAVVKTLGAIDLDPCAEPARGVPASCHYTPAEDGLAQAWHGRVFCNPPYGKALLSWVEKFVSEHQGERMTAGILLCPARPDTRWFDRLSPYPRCYIRGRLTFIAADGNREPDPAGFPSMLVYAGTDVARFARATRRLGRVYPGAMEHLVRTTNEKRQAVLRVLADPASEVLSDREIARRAGVSHTYVARHRAAFRVEAGG